MVYGSLVVCKDSKGEVFYQIDNGCFNGYRNYEVKAKTVGQFTGLKDKNGKEIYEGDILRGVSNNEFSKGNISNYELVWGIDKWHIKGTFFSLQELFNYCNNNIEITGNIHQNPELLKNQPRRDKNQTP